MNDLLLLKLRNAIADKEAIIANMNMETAHRDGWSGDWNAQLIALSDEINFILAELK